MNPTAEASQKQLSELESSKQEVARLRERLRLVEEGVTQDLTLVVNDRVGGASAKEIEGATSMNAVLLSTTIKTIILMMQNTCFFNMTSKLIVSGGNLSIALPLAAIVLI